MRYKVLGISHGYSQDTYVVQLIDGEWGTDKELIDFCDPCNFGGSIQDTPKPDIKKVVVYTD